jgi:hypothetical protein
VRRHLPCGRVCSLSRCRDSCRKLDQVKVVGSTKVVELWTRYVVGSRASDVIVCPSAGCPYFGVRVTVLQLLSHTACQMCGADCAETCRESRIGHSAKHFKVRSTCISRVPGIELWKSCTSVSRCAPTHPPMVAPVRSCVLWKGMPACSSRRVNCSIFLETNRRVR